MDMDKQAYSVRAQFLLVEYCNFTDFPIGGQLTFARQVARSFGKRVALAGISTGNTPVGKWIEKVVDGEVHWFYCYDKVQKSTGKPVVPGRLSNYAHLRRHKDGILELGVRNALVQAPEALIAISEWDWESLCYNFPGVENPLRMPRYRWGKVLARSFERSFFKALGHVDVILAGADQKSIQKLSARDPRRLRRDRIISFPSRVDVGIFQHISKKEARAAVGLNGDGPVVVNCGRLNVVKGWKFLLGAFRMLMENEENARLIFVGDGEDRPLIEGEIAGSALKGRVQITGFQPPDRVVNYINAADVVAFASVHEGWSNAMLEALACGRPVVTAEVSGARELIIDGVNGFVVPERDEQAFARAMQRAGLMDTPIAYSQDKAREYSVENLAGDLSVAWPNIAWQSFP